MYIKIFSFIFDNFKGLLRNKKDIVKYVYEVLIFGNERECIVKGIKGLFWFLFLENFDIVVGMGIDYMYGVFLGV